MPLAVHQVRIHSKTHWRTFSHRCLKVWKIRAAGVLHKVSPRAGNTYVCTMRGGFFICACAWSVDYRVSNREQPTHKPDEVYTLLRCEVHLQRNWTKCVLVFILATWTLLTTFMASQDEVSLVNNFCWLARTNEVGGTLYSVSPAMSLLWLSLKSVYLCYVLHAWPYMCLYMRVQDNAGINVWPQFVYF